MLAKENARLRNKHSALEREQNNLLQVSNPVVSIRQFCHLHN